MRYGIRRDAAPGGDPDAMLGRYWPTPDRVARVVLHPHITVIPVPADDHDGLRETFTLDVSARVFDARDVYDALADADRAERAAEYDELIAAIEEATTQFRDTATASDAAERVLQDARVRLDHVAAQRAHADEAFTAARERLTYLDNVGTRAEEADAIRAQIASVQRSLEESATNHTEAVDTAERAAEAARRETSAATRRLQVMLERAEPSARLEEAASVLSRVRERRALLDAEDTVSEAGRMYRVLAQAPEPVLVLVEPFADPPDDLLEAAESVLALKRIVIATENNSVLQRARALDPGFGAARTPLVTAAIARIATHGSDWNRK
jgi:hypothetical protein